jgi:hypothetical protein
MKLDVNDPKLVDYLRAHLQEGWSITNFHKYISKKDHPYFRNVVCERPEFVELREKHRKYYVSPYGKVRQRKDFA